MKLSNEEVKALRNLVLLHTDVDWRELDEGEDFWDRLFVKLDNAYNMGTED